MTKEDSIERPDLFVVARILEKLWKENSPMLKTRLQVASNVNYDVFRRYLNWMLERQLVSIANSDDGHERIVLLPKGHDAYRRLIRLLNELIKNA